VGVDGKSSQLAISSRLRITTGHLSFGHYLPPCCLLKCTP